MPKATTAGASDMGADQAAARRELGDDATQEEVDAKVQELQEARPAGSPELADRTLATGEPGDAPAVRAADAAHREAELRRDADGNVVGSSDPRDRVDGQPDAEARLAAGQTDDDVLRENGRDVPPAANSVEARNADPDAFNPSDHTVADVNDYLARLGEDDDRTVDEANAERDRVLDLERADKNRTGITGGTV